MRLACIVGIVLLTLASGPALGQKPSEEPSKPDDKTPPAAKQQEPSLGHRFQFGLGLRTGTGYRVIMPYGEENCGDADKSVCGGRQPFWLEISPSFGVTDSLEVLVDVRLVLEEDISRTHGFFFAPGIKYYTDAESLLKFYFTGQVVLENQEQEQEPSLDAFDVGIRSALGIQFDILRYVGLFAQGGIIIGFKRWLTFVVDFAAGVQVRY